MTPLKLIYQWLPYAYLAGVVIVIAVWIYQGCKPPRK